MKIFISILFSVLYSVSMAQYAPAVGKPGSTAIYMDSNAIVAWATQCTVYRGWQNSANHSLGKTSLGSISSVYGKADNDVLSLGDGGFAIIQFTQSIANSSGPDFVVFENAFDDYFLELAFVEVSSDGQNYFRFPAHSLTQVDSQITTFGQLQTENIHNLAGKYRASYGTPFDLEELKNTIGLDIMHITHIKIIDVVGSIDTNYATKDADNHIINDPFPTPFASGGFDLDAVGVLHTTISLESQNNDIEFRVYPNPARDYITIQTIHFAELEVVSAQGRVIIKKQISKGKSIIRIDDLANGIYFIRLTTNSTQSVRTFVKQRN